MSKIRNIALLALLASGSALAADPASGTLSPAMPEQSYTYGPNTISNPSGTGQLTCAEPAAPCDAYALTVDVPTGNFQMTIFTTWDVEGEDYDLYLLNEAGMEIASSASSDPTETIILPNLQAGNYTVRLVPFLVTGSTATTTITLSGASGGGGGGSSVIPDPVGTSATPRYKVHVAPEGLANESGEPTIGNELEIGGQPANVPS